MRHIGTLDELQMYDMSTNKTIITAVLFFDKFDADVILERLRSRMLGHLRLRSLFVKMFDSYYLKELDEAQLKVLTEDAFFKLETLIDGTVIKTEKHLLSFL